MRTTNAGHAALLGILACHSVACDAPDHSDIPRSGLVAETPTQGGGPPPGQRWVLRDSEGAAVNAVVEPTCRGNGPDCVVNEIGAMGAVTPECARLIWLGDQYVDLKYDLTTGQPGDCSPSSPNAWDFAVFADDECAGPFHTSADSGVETASRFTRRARYITNEGTLYYQASEPVEAATWYCGAGCVPCGGDPSYLPWLPVPDWARDALAAPPYTLSWE